MTQEKYELRIHKIKNLKDKVAYVLLNDKQARDCDVRLTCLVWFKFQEKDLFKNQEDVWSVQLRDMQKLPRADNVSRWRRKIQNEDGFWLPTTWEVARKRNINKIAWRNALGV